MNFGNMKLGAKMEARSNCGWTRRSHPTWLRAKFAFTSGLRQPTRWTGKFAGASCIAGSDRPNHCCIKWICSASWQSEIAAVRFYPSDSAARSAQSVSTTEPRVPSLRQIPAYVCVLWTNPDRDQFVSSRPLKSSCFRDSPRTPHARTFADFP